MADTTPSGVAELRAPSVITALRYVAVSVVAAPDGAQVYSFVFQLKDATGAIYTLGARYSLLRRLSLLLAAEQPAASAALPAFPPKYSLYRQTPDFLLERGRALEAYLGAALGDSRLAAVPAVREFLRAAELNKPASPAPQAVTGPPAGSDTFSPSPGPALRLSLIHI